MSHARFPDLSSYSKTANPLPPQYFGTRYDRSGAFLPEPGNTVVCHLVENTETEAALIAARARYLAMPEAGQIAFTPISSLHMTLFQGIIEYRRRLPFWPADVPLDSPIDEMTAMYAERLASFAGGPAFRVQVTEAVPTGLVVDGVTEADCAALKAWRNDLAEIFGYRHPDHETYKFHITFGYMIERLDDAAIPNWQSMLGEVAEDIRRRVDYLELRAPTFCRFADMNHFEVLKEFAVGP
ncbi:DUF1868 domain-containing protein [Rhizobiaceae bacterium n13]|uniref:DUF1868 domain-containing protein n=1 Tax=Ferirhizobium litorale TaxID=2927786 RepID=A0AAE3U273_9HYPH|nr:DUF1868 domain-containing protein [Fererhizobium litorale]MDI7860925.1 DUF1868 domain-containing protein [Fererhizobium litorale]MDI7921073.1 DUF1868 domain-containing protein [Fererhizobium litorale]